MGPILGRDEVRGVDEISGKECAKNKLDLSNFAFLFCDVCHVALGLS